MSMIWMIGDYVIEKIKHSARPLCVSIKIPVNLLTEIFIYRKPNQYGGLDDMTVCFNS